MINVIESKLNLIADKSLKHDYQDCISELAQHQLTRSLDNFVHHRNVSRLEHCIHVSYYSYLICKKWGLDYESAARGGLLHDFYFYNSHTTKPEWGIHCFSHPSIALKNAQEHFTLNEVEKDIIVKHMWPVTISKPKFKESYVVTMMDKYCATREVAKYGNKFAPVQQAQFATPSHR